MQRLYYKTEEWHGRQRHRKLIYVHLPSLAQLREDLAAFLRSAEPSQQ